MDDGNNEGNENNNKSDDVPGLGGEVFLERVGDFVSTPVEAWAAEVPMMTMMYYIVGFCLVWRREDGVWVGRGRHLAP